MPPTNVKVLDIADAVVTDLNAASFSQAFTATRSLQPHYELPDLTKLKVTVLPKARAETPNSRATDSVDYSVDVGVQKKLNSPLTQAELNALMLLVKEVTAFLNRRTPSGQEVTWVGTLNEPIFAQEHLKEMNQFTSVLTVTYRAVETPT